MVLPPTVSGFALLLAFGRMGLAGRTLGMFGIQLPFTTLGVVLAQVFMAVPFFVLAARSGFESVDVRLREAARTLRAGEMHAALHVLLPIALPSLAAGATMACARAVGEFGATITFAGNMPGVTQTMPLAVYLALQTDLDAAIALSVLLVALAIGLLVGVRATGGAGAQAPSVLEARLSFARGVSTRRRAHVRRGRDARPRRRERLGQDDRAAAARGTRAAGSGLRARRRHRLVRRATWLPDRARSVGYVAQGDTLFPHLDAFANVAFGPRALALPRREAERRARRARARRRGRVGGAQAARAVGRAAASASRSPARSCSSRRCSCSTSRSRRSTPGRGARCAPTSRSGCPALPCATVLVTHSPSRRSRWATASPRSRTGGSSRRATARPAPAVRARATSPTSWA
jgi:molybdate transport system permease protein